MCLRRSNLCKSIYMRTVERFHDFFCCEDDVYPAGIIRPAILDRKPHLVQQEAIQDF